MVPSLNEDASDEDGRTLGQMQVLNVVNQFQVCAGGSTVFGTVWEAWRLLVLCGRMILA